MLSRWIKNAVLIVASALMAAGGVELAARVYIHFHPQPPNNLYDFRVRGPLPYRGAPYFSREFIDESFAEPGGWITTPGTRLVLPGDFHGRWFNVEGGRRRTTDQPPAYKKRLLLFGGSTVYAAEAPDAYTIPSCLQRLLNARAPGAWRVENLGSITVNVAQQLELLKTVPLRTGDVVVFYDGVNDIVQGIFNGNPQGWIVGNNRAQLHASGAVKALLIRWNVKLLAAKAQNYSYFLKYAVGDAMNRGNCIVKDFLRDPKRVEALAHRTAELFAAELREARTYTEAKGGEFIHVLQPNLYVQPVRSDYEKEILRNCYINPAGLDTAFAAGYPVLRGQPDTGIDFTEILWRRSSGEEYYLDYCHVNHAANERIARALMAEIDR